MSTLAKAKRICDGPFRGQYIIESVIMQHAEEVAFLAILRHRCLAAPHYSLNDLAKLDLRIVAHLDGLGIAGDVGWDISKDALGLKGRGEVFTGAVLAFESGKEERIGDVLTVGLAFGKLTREVVSALGWISFSQVRTHLDCFLASYSASLRRIGIAGYAVHRQDLGISLKNCLSNMDVPLRSRALKAVGELGRLDLLPAVQAHVRADDPDIVFQAARSAALLGDLSGALVLKGLTEAAGPYAERAGEIAMRRIHLCDALGWQRQLAGRPQSQRLSVQGAGMIGDPALLPWLIEQMAIPSLARVAGEAFTFITGVDLTYHDLDAEWPEGFQAGPTEAPDDDNVEMDPDEDLPWPNLKLIEQWWAKHRGEFQKGVRHLVGKPIADEWLWQVLKVGRQRQRAAAAIELSMRQPGRPLFNVKAPGFRQMELLSTI